MTTTPTLTPLEEATISIVFALRDSLSDDGPSRLDFWSGGRAISALEAAAAGASSAGHAITIAARKLQIPQIIPSRADTVTAACQVIDTDFAAWQSLIDTSSVYLLALADVIRQSRKPTK